MLNLNHLYYFYTAAQHKTITHAAKTLGISQPSLTSQLKLLEGQIESPLFRRSGRNVFLTLEGERLFKHCKPIFESVFELESKIHHHHSTPYPTLRIGFTEQIEGVFITELVSKILTFNREPHPTQRMSVICDKKEVLLNQIKNHQIDLVFSNTNTTEPDIEIIQHFKMPVGLYLATSLFKKNFRKSWLELLKNQELGLALPSNQVRLRHEADECLERLKVKNTVIFESSTLSLVARAVVDGVGIGFFPKPYLWEEEKDQKVVCISGSKPLWHHSLYLASHHHFEQTPSIQKLIVMIREYFSQFEAISFDSRTYPTDRVQNQTL